MDETVQHVIEDSIDRIFEAWEKSWDEFWSEYGWGGPRDYSKRKDTSYNLRSKAWRLEQIAEAFNESITTRIRTIKRHSNQLCPIHRLPIEILSTIFHAVVTSAEDQKYYPALYKLIGVSSAWAAIITSTPRLWNLIPPPRRPKSVHRLTDLALQRCGQASLNVSSYWLGTDQNTDRKLCRRVETWQSAELIAGPWTQCNSDVWPWRTTEAPRLQTFTLRHGNRHFEDITGNNNALVKADIFGGVAPKLRKLVLDGIEIYWGSDVFSRLEVLKIGWAENSSLSLPAVLEILQKCASTLQELALHRAEVESSTTVSTSSVELPYLTILALRNMDCHCVHALLSHIHASKCKQLVLDIEGEDEDLILFNDSTSHFRAFFTKSISSAHHITFLLSGPEFLRMYVWESETTLTAELTIHDYDTVDTLDWATSTFELGTVLTPITVVEEKLGPGEMTGLCWSLRHLPSITAIKTTAGPGDLVDLADFLEKPYLEDGVSRWRCPNLESLTFYNVARIPQQELISMFKSRYEKAQVTLEQFLRRSEIGRIVEKPKPFASVNFVGSTEGIDERGFSIMTKILGDRVITMWGTVGAEALFPPAAQELDLHDSEDAEGSSYSESEQGSNSDSDTH